jgi:hypothetical protein
MHPAIQHIIACQGKVPENYLGKGYISKPLMLLAYLGNRFFIKQ